MNITNEILLSTWLPFIVAALVQASFGLGVSMLTLISGHTLYKKRSHGRLIGLSQSYIWGAIIATVLLLTLVVYVFQTDAAMRGYAAWIAISGVAAGIGVAILLFYYRRGRGGTMLWLPRVAAEFLYKRTKRTKNSFEAFSLGLAAIFAELIFVAAPLLVAGILLADQPTTTQLIGIAIYTIIAVLPLIVMFVLIAGGHKISRLQAWRENNKTFLQVMAGFGLVVLAVYVFVYHAVGVWS